jgi:hypothetical protein
MLGLDFHVTEPRELVEAVARLGERYRNAVPTERLPRSQSGQ